MVGHPAARTHPTLLGQERSGTSTCCSGTKPHHHPRMLRQRLSPKPHPTTVSQSAKHHMTGSSRRTAPNRGVHNSVSNTPTGRPRGSPRAASCTQIGSTTSAQRLGEERGDLLDASACAATSQGPTIHRKLPRSEKAALVVTLLLFPVPPTRSSRTASSVLTRVLDITIHSCRLIDNHIAS